jgi:MscS family membrane protein
MKLLALSFALTLLLPVTAAAVEPNPLSSVDTSSPRALLLSFSRTMDDGYAEIAGVVRSFVSSDRLYMNNTERTDRDRGVHSMRKAVNALDLSSTSPVLRDFLAAERVLQLKEILDRIELPAPSDVPDHAQMLQASRKRWRLPNTEIDIVLIEDGVRAGEYLIAAPSVEKLHTYFEHVKHLPYRPGPAKELSVAIQSISGGRIDSIYEYYLSTPAVLDRVVPLRWMLALPNLPRPAGLAVWQWLGLVFCLLIGGLLLLAVSRLARRRVEPPDEVGPPGFRPLAMPAAIVLVAGLLLPTAAVVLRFGGTPGVVLAYALDVAVFLAAAWLALAAGNVIGEQIVASQRLLRRSLDSQVIRLGTRLVGLVAALACLIEGADDLGFPAYSVLAGLGVGGFAVALAARENLANLLGSVLIMLEKPFRIGQWIKVDSCEGIVEDVGFRSTRVRTFENSVVFIPNNELINAGIENISMRSMRRQRFVLQVNYDTPKETLRRFVDGVREIIDNHRLTDSERLYVQFNQFGNSALEILVYFYLKVSDYEAELREREDILLKIVLLARESNVDFAFPTRSIRVEATPHGRLNHYQDDGV